MADGKRVTQTAKVDDVTVLCYASWRMRAKAAGKKGERRKAKGEMNNESQ
jgi:hypothetical protein